MSEMTLDRGDTVDVHSSAAFLILMEWEKFCKAVGMVRLERWEGVILFKAGPRLEELGRGCTVRQAVRDGYKRFMREAAASFGEQR